MGWITKLVVLGVVGYGGYEAYLLHKGGYFDLPVMAYGSYTVSFKSGLRGIVVDAEVSTDALADSHKIFRRLSDANPDRRYLGIPFDVPVWFKDEWSTCIKPSEEELQYIEASLSDDAKQQLTGARLDAFCYIETDGDQRIARGLIYSVPKL
jgi:hypothetical protein